MIRLSISRTPISEHLIKWPPLPITDSPVARPVWRIWIFRWARLRVVWSIPRFESHLFVGKLKAAKSAHLNEQVSPEVRCDGKTAIITGSGAEIGRSYALLLARLGANVVMVDVNEKHAKAVVDEIQEV